MGRDNGLLCMPDHIQELWHSEAIRAIISYWAKGLLYVWAKFLIYSGKTFYHHTIVKFIHHRKNHHVTLHYNLLHPVSWITHTANSPSQKSCIWSEKCTHYKAVGQIMLKGWLFLLNQKGSVGAYEFMTGMEIVDRHCQWSPASWSHPVQEVQDLRRGWRGATLNIRSWVCFYSQLVFKLWSLLPWDALSCYKCLGFKKSQDKFMREKKSIEGYFKQDITTR